jgi:hypothetical protein
MFAWMKAFQQRSLVLPPIIRAKPFISDATMERDLAAYRSRPTVKVTTIYDESGYAVGESSAWNGEVDG